MAKVMFFPSPGSVPVEVCKVRYGKSMLYTQNTDTISNNADIAEFLAFKNNLGVTAFINSVNSPNAGKARDFVKSGRIGLGVYFPTDRWLDPVTGIYQVIPDYMATAWSAAGAAAFENATEGQPKPPRYPDHGQDMYDMTNGRLGIDLATGTVGTSNMAEYLGVADTEIGYVSHVNGNRASVFSYRNGRNGSPAIYAQRFIGGRNSNYSIAGDSYTGYGDSGNPTGIDRVEQVDRPSSMRWWDFWNNQGGGTMQDADDYMEQEFGKTALNNGWFNDFTHWHTAGASNLEHYFDFVGGLLLAHDAYSCPYDEAIKYLLLKSFVKRVTAKEVSDMVKVFVDVRELFGGQSQSGLPLGVPMQLLDIPLSVRVDLSGTSLGGLDVVCDVGGLIKYGDEVIVEIPVTNARDGVLVATLSATSSPSYLNIAKPVLTKSGSVVYSDIPVNFVVWNSSRVPLHRTTIAQLNIDIGSMSAAEYVGAISDRGQSAVIEL